ncbi:MAG: pseudouridine synthase [Thermoanaerobaculia bacterium]
MSSRTASPERLQKVLSRAGVASRRAAEQLIREGRVTVNGEIAEIGRKVDLTMDSVKVDGKRVTRPERNRYLLLNKPPGYMTTRTDPEGRPTVFDLLPPQVRRRLFAVGRLDFDTEGLLLLTDDGDLAQMLSHPRHGVPKSYEAKVKGRPSSEAIGKLRAGIVLSGRRTRPARLQALEGNRGRRSLESNSWWRVEIKEGRTRQIREMFARVGHPVMRLRRVAIGSVEDRRLPRGGYRDLSEAELRKLSRGQPEGTAKKAKRRS